MSSEPLSTERGDEHAAHLPVELSSFIGRERELAAAQTRFRSTRLLTLTGAGGSGKTRLALELATREARNTPVVWISLAPVENENSVTDAVLLALGVQPQATVSGADMLFKVLHDRRIILVLDNCEHLINACAALVDALLRTCPELRVLATSREALGVAGETAWLVPPLSLPEIGAIAQSEAVQLFVERAQSVVPGFSLTETNADVIAQICRRLDGLPLALELAAARLRTLPLEHMAERLDDCFRLLTSRNRRTAARHQTLRAAIDWSYQLLSQHEQQFLARLSAFAGSFSLEAAEAVCAGEDITTDAVLDLIASLVEKSLVTLVESPEDARYRLLETIRQYAQEQLAAHGEIELCRTRHMQYFIELAAQAEPHFTTAQRQPWTQRLQEDLDNLRAALLWTYEYEPVMHLRLLGSLCWFWYSVGLWTEGRQRLSAALQLPEAHAASLERANILFSAGALACLQGEPLTSLPWLRESAALAKTFAHEKLEAYSLNYIGMAFGQRGDPQCVAPTEAALAWARRTGDLYAGRLALLILGHYELRIGNKARAESLMHEAVAAARSFGLNRELGIALNFLATVLLANGEAAQAVAVTIESIKVFRQDPQYLFVARSLELLAGLACRRKAFVEAACLFGAGHAVRQSIASTPFEVDAEWIATNTRTARAAIGNDVFNRAWKAGCALSMMQSIDHALSLSDVLVKPSDDDAVRSITPAAQTQESVDTQPQLRVRALGALVIEGGGSAVPATLLRHAKVRELLLYLLSHPEGRSREAIGLALWPDASDAQVRNNFHVTLHQLRKSLGGAHWVQLDRNLYRLGPEQHVEFDADTFERETLTAMQRVQHSDDATRELRQALALYRGDLLANETLPEWILETRERLRNLHIDGLAMLGEVLIKSGRHHEAIELLEGTFRDDPTNERTCQQLMTALAQLGRSAEALRCYERLRKALMQELGVTPTATTQKLMQRLQRNGA